MWQLGGKSGSLQTTGTASSSSVVASKTTGEFSGVFKDSFGDVAGRTVSLWCGRYPLFIASDTHLASIGRRSRWLYSDSVSKALPPTGDGQKRGEQEANLRRKESIPGCTPRGATPKVVVAGCKPAAVTSYEPSGLPRGADWMRGPVKSSPLDYPDSPLGG